MNASVPANDAAWLSRTRTFVLLGLLVFLLFGVLIRARIQLGSTLPPSSPWQWHLVGLAEDAFSAGLLALVLMIFARGPRRAAAIRRLFGLLVVVLSVLHLIKSEAVLHFGTAIRPEHFQLGPVFTTMQRSIRDYSGLLLIGSVAAVSVSLWLASHIARNVRRLAVTILGMLVLVVASAAIVLTPWEVHRREMIRSPLLALVDVILGQRSSRGSSVQAAPAMSSREVSQVRELAGSPRSFLTPEYPLAYRPPARDPAAPKSPPGLRPNVVFIALENLRTEEVGAYGASVKGVTPHLDRLAAEGIRFEHAYSGGSYTTTAEAGLWYGIPGLPGLGLVRDNAEIRLTGLPEILRTAGWRSFFWISSTDQNFFKRSEFYEPRGFQMFDGNDFPKSDPRVNWGVSDRALARRSVEALNRLREPFAAMILTVNNHHPYQLPRDAGPLLGGLPAERRGFAKFGDKGQLLGLHSSQMIQTIHYSDQAVGDFFEASARQPWFSRTIFVITGDHGNPVVPLGRQVETTHELSDLSYRVPLILYSPLLQGGTMVHSPASHADLLPTILGFAGVDSARSGIGTDLLGGTLDPDRPVFTWNAADLSLRITTARFVYYATIPASGLPDSGPYPDELLIDPVRDPSGRQNISSQNPAAVERFRRLARSYAEVYPSLVRAGRSGLPPGAAGSSDDS